MGDMQEAVTFYFSILQSSALLDYRCCYTWRDLLILAVLFDLAILYMAIPCAHEPKA